MVGILLALGGASISTAAYGHRHNWASQCSPEQVAFVMRLEDSSRLRVSVLILDPDPSVIAHVDFVLLVTSSECAGVGS